MTRPDNSMPAHAPITPHTTPPPGLWARLLGSLSRVTSSGRYVPVIDGLRFVAIMAVMLFHINESLVVSRPELEAPARKTLLFHVLKVGGVGVPLFFAISGFILTLPFLEALEKQRPFALGRYFLRRLTRLEPPYIVNLLLITTLLVFVNHQSPGDLIAPLLASLGYVHSLIYGTMSQINFVAWSLEVEVQFYLLAPLLAWCLLRFEPRTRRTLLALLIVAGCLLKISVEPAYTAPGPMLKRLILSLVYHLDEFLVGMLLADIYLTNWHSQPPQSFRWDIVGLGSWILIIISQWHPYWRHALPLIMFAAYYATFRSLWISRLLSWKLITVIGGMCYTLYLYHFYVISLVNKFTIHRLAGVRYEAALAIQIALILPLAILGGAVLFRTIEFPFMVWQPFPKKQVAST